MSLTDRQREVLRELAAGLSPSEISYSLSISRTALQHHIQTIRKRYGVFSYREAVEIARSRGDL